MANHASDDDKFIIIGISESGRTKTIAGVQKSTDEATYRQYINENIEPTINFEYKTAKVDEKKICFFRIFNNKDRPYLVKQDVINPRTNKPDFKKGDGFIRTGRVLQKSAELIHSKFLMD